MAETLGFDAQFGKEFLYAARGYIGKSYVSHMEAVRCGGRRTLPVCLEVGLGPEQFDCTGLILRAAADVLGRTDFHWAGAVRHASQMAKTLPRLAISWQEELPIGAIMVYSHTFDDVYVPTAHVGIYAGRATVLHARSSRRNGSSVDKVSIDPVRAPWASKRFNFAVDGSALAQLALLTREC